MVIPVLSFGNGTEDAFHPLCCFKSPTVEEMPPVTKCSNPSPWSFAKDSQCQKREMVLVGELESTCWLEEYLTSKPNRANPPESSEGEHLACSPS